MEHTDVLIIGAGLSGIGAARHLRHRLPAKTFAILERRDAIGGTWDLFRYPGVRSDSDMYTLGYSFKPWKGEHGIAEGSEIRGYIREAAREGGVDRKILYGYRVVRVEWSSEDATWTVEARVGDETVRRSCNFLMMCSGYYDYDRAHVPDFPGREGYRGRFVVPQFWPEDLDYAGKSVVVIGSGATAVTVAPAMAETAGHVTILQRSPSYVINVPRRNAVAGRLRRFLPEMLAYRLTRTRSIALSALLYRLSRSRPGSIRRKLMDRAREQLGEGFDMRHFSPAYNPWDERLCVTPDGELFQALKQGKASIVTARIDRFTETGVLLEGGPELEADVVVCATGLELQMFGGVQVVVDGADYDVASSLTYKGMMYSDLPNLSNTTGYTNASWTLKADLIAEYVCRLLRHMDRKGASICVPRVDRAKVRSAPYNGLASGYFRRAAGQLPQHGDRAPWKPLQSYPRDRLLLRRSKVDDGVMEFRKPTRDGGPATRP